MDSMFSPDDIDIKLTVTGSEIMLQGYSYYFNLYIRVKNKVFTYTLLPRTAICCDFVCESICKEINYPYINNFKKRYAQKLLAYKSSID